MKRFFLRPFLIFAFLVPFAGCTRSAPVINPYLPSLVSNKPAIIFVHGFYGASLRERGAGRRVFLTGMEAMFGSSALSLYQQELGTPRGPELEVEGLLGTVQVVPALYGVDVYSTLIKELRASHEKSQVLPLVYDWRDDLTLAVEKLDTLVQLLREKGVTKISIVAHSMGGLVATYYLGYGNQPPATAKINWEGARHVQKAVFFGVPFGGSMIAFRSFEKGSGLPKSERLLNADTMSSFPSLYQLLPLVSTVLDPSGGEPVSLHTFDPALWKKHRFGLLRREGLAPGLVTAREAFTEEQLAKAQRWRDLVQLGRTTEWPAPNTLKVLNVVSDDFDTLDRAYFSPASGKLLFDPEEVEKAGLKMAALYRTGDGTVSRTSAEVPPAMASVTKIVTTDYPHEKLFLDPAVETEYNAFLWDRPSAAPAKNGD